MPLPATLFAVCFLAIPCLCQTANGLRISELFPRAQADCPEWLELANTSNSTLNLKKWVYGNADDTCTISVSDLIIQAGGYAVLTKDKALFTSKYPAVIQVFQPVTWKTMDNYHDTLFIRDSSGIFREAAGWDYRWFESWTVQALARVSFSIDGCDQRAWTVASNPSPGQPNAESVWKAGKAELDIGPIPFTPNNDGKDDYLSVSIVLPPASSAVVSIYGFEGRKYLDLPQPPVRTYLWNGSLSSGAAAPVGPFYVVAEITCNGAKQVLRKKGVLWR